MNEQPNQSADNSNPPVQPDLPTVSPESAPVESFAPQPPSVDGPEAPAVSGDAGVAPNDADSQVSVQAVQAPVDPVQQPATEEPVTPAPESTENPTFQEPAGQTAPTTPLPSSAPETITTSMAPNSTQPQAFGSADQPVAPVPASSGTGLAVAALVLGILAIVPPAPFIPFVNLINVVVGVAAVVLGVMHLRKLKKSLSGTGKGLALAGIITGAAAILLSVAVTALAIAALGSLTGATDTVEVASYGNLDSDAVKEQIDISSTTRAEVDDILGGTPSCESDECTYRGGNLKEGVTVKLYFEEDKITGISTSSSSINISQ